jgi:uncharacterized protein (DUF2252 family)
MVKQAIPNVVDAIQQFNTGRDPERLAIKLAKMRENPFIFLRGACHLFYDALPDDPLLDQAPLAWCCGDLHFENFGSYKADNRLVYFDVSDYDEGALAPCTWDIVRLLTSIHCGADALRATPAEALAVSRDCLTGYREALLRSKPLWVERDTSSGLIHDLLADLQQRNRADFLDRRTARKNGQRRLKVDGAKALPASEAEQNSVAEFMARFGAEQSSPGFFKVLDVARRIAGTGSLGVGRFVILIEGKGSPDGNYLLDLKEAKPSALSARLKRLGVGQPAWQDEAQRVVSVQKRMQVVDHAFLFPVAYQGTPCVLKGLQPTEDRVAIGDWGKKLDRLREVVRTMGQVLAWDQLRASGRNGAATVDQLIQFAQGEAWMQATQDAAATMTKVTKQQWETFAKSAT